MFFPGFPPVREVAGLGSAGHAAHSPLAGHQCIEEHDPVYALTTLIGNTGDRDAGEGGTHQDGAVESLKLEDLCNIGNVSFQPYFRAREMQALTAAGAGGGVDPMASSPQSVRDVLPYPATVPGAMH